MQRQRGGPQLETGAPRRDGVPLFTVAATLALLVAVGCVLVFGGVLGSPELRSWTSDAVSVPLALLAALAAVRAAVRAHGRTRLAWVLLAVGSACWTVGELIWFVERGRAAQPGVGWSDLFYLVGVPFVVAGVACFPANAWHGPERARVVLDALTIGGSVLFVFRTFGVFSTTEGTLLEQVVQIAYPAGDVVMLCVALMVMTRATRRSVLHLSLLVTGMAAYAVGDTIFAIQEGRGDYVSGSMLDLTWNVAYLLFALAALAPWASADLDPAATPQAYRGLRVPWVLVGLALITVAVVAAVRPPTTSDPVAGVIGLGVALTFAVRQAWLFSDLTRLNQRLRRQNERTELAANAVLDGILVANRHGRVIYANTTGAELLGRDVDVLPGTDVFDLLARDEHPEGEGSEVLRAVAEGTAVTQAASAFVRPDGAVVPVELSVGPLSHDRPAGVILVFRDVSARRAVERMKNEFMSVISHEVRTPLTSIRGSLALLDGGVAGDLPPDSRRMIGIALESSERLSRLINDILDVERLESGLMRLVVADHQASQLVRSAVREMAGLAQTVGVELVAEEADGLVTVDADRIVQVLTNLVGNAVKFSPPGSQVHVSARFSGDTVDFAVRDHGRGIPRDKLETIFDRFEQVDSSDARQQGGTGLGLAICRDIVRLHGGRIWAVSELGEGAEFRFRLPRAATTADPVTPYAVVEPV